MNGLDKFQIGRSANFEKGLQKILRAHYRKNSAGLAEFVELIQKFINLLSVNPRPRPPLGHLEPFPQGSSRAGWELWKLEFKMPQLRGASGQGRLIYLLDIAQKAVIFAWIYTHAEFEKRPPDKSLKQALLEMMEFEEVSEESNGSAAADEETGEQE